MEPFTCCHSLSVDTVRIHPPFGAELAPQTISGLPESAHSFYAFDGSIKLRDAVAGFKRGKIAVVVSAMPYKCPGAPHEGAMLLADYFRRRGLRQNVEVHLFTPTDSGATLQRLTTRARPVLLRSPPLS